MDELVDKRMKGAIDEALRDYTITLKEKLSALQTNIDHLLKPV